MLLYGLPAYPVMSGMTLGHFRGNNEIVWLLTHGFFIDRFSASFYKYVLLAPDMVRITTITMHSWQYNNQSTWKHVRDIPLQEALDSEFKYTRFGLFEWYGNEESSPFSD